MEFGDLFSFDKKIAPAIIKPMYWISMLLIVAFGVFYFLYGFFSIFWHPGSGLWLMLTSVISVPVGVLALRIVTELCLSIFEIHEKVIGGSAGPI